MNFSDRRQRVGYAGLIPCAVAVVFSATGFGFIRAAQAQIVAFGASNVAGRGVRGSKAMSCSSKPASCSRAGPISARSCGKENDRWRF
jgi:hypothetical protein